MDGIFPPALLSASVSKQPLLTNIGLTVLQSTGLMSKVLSVNPADNTLVSDSTHCRMVTGTAHRTPLHSPIDLATLISSLQSNEALALGSLNPALPDICQIFTAKKLREAVATGSVLAPGQISRTRQNIDYAPGRPAIILIDFDRKGMPAKIATRIEAEGGIVAVLTGLVPELATCARVSRQSTSSGLLRTDIGQPMPSAGGLHLLLWVADGSDAKRFLQTLHDRAWLAGYGWYTVGKLSKLIERSVIDRSTWGGERLVFEGAAVVSEPLWQDPATRVPSAYDGPLLHTLTACPQLNTTDTVTLKQLQTHAADALQPERARIRAANVAALVHAGASYDQAGRIIADRCNHVLRPDFIPAWADDEFIGCSIGDVLKDPQRFAGAELYDPDEGVEYGHVTAWVGVREDGSPWIHSFAHGTTIYELRYDFKAVEAALNAAEVGSDVVRLFAKLASVASLDTLEISDLTALVAKRSNKPKSEIKGLLKTEEVAREDRSYSEQVAEAVTRLNERYFFVNDCGKPWVFRKFHDAILHRDCYERIRPKDDLEQIHKNDVIFRTTKDGPKPITVSDAWMRSPDRRQYLNGVVFDPGEIYGDDPDRYNLWQGWAETPKPGSWIRMKTHIYNIFCGGDLEQYSYFLGWHARMFQRPGEVAGTAIVIKGDPGCGKGIFARSINRICGQHGLHITHASHLVGNFNAHRRDAVFLFADEAFFAGNPAHADLLNGLITEPVQMIEYKGRDVVPAPNYIHILMASNNEWVVPTSLKDRRMAVFSALNNCCGNIPYFDALAEEMENGGYAAMLHELLTADIRWFDPRKIPDTTGLQEQKKLSLNTQHSWWYDVLLRGYLNPGVGWQETMSTDYLYSDYKTYAKDVRNERHLMSRERFAQFLVSMGGTSTKPRTVDGHRLPSYTFGAMAIARAAFCKVTKLSVTWHDDSAADAETTASIDSNVTSFPTRAQNSR